MPINSFPAPDGTTRYYGQSGAVSWAARATQAEAQADEALHERGQPVPYVRHAEMPAGYTARILSATQAAQVAEGAVVLAEQFPGMPQAQCHGCGLPSHVARCQSATCPMKDALSAVPV